MSALMKVDGVSSLSKLLILSLLAALLMMIVVATVSIVTEAVVHGVSLGHSLVGWSVYVCAVVFAEDISRAKVVWALVMRLGIGLNRVSLMLAIVLTVIESALLFAKMYEVWPTGAESNYWLALLVLTALLRVAVHFLLCKYGAIGWKAGFLLFSVVACLHGAANGAGLYFAVVSGGSISAIYYMIPVSIALCVLIYGYGRLLDQRVNQRLTMA